MNANYFESYFLIMIEKNTFTQLMAVYYISETIICGAVKDIRLSWWLQLRVTWLCLWNSTVVLHDSSCFHWGQTDDLNRNMSK